MTKNNKNNQIETRNNQPPTTGTTAVKTTENKNNIQAETTTTTQTQPETTSTNVGENIQQRIKTAVNKTTKTTRTGEIEIEKTTRLIKLKPPTTNNTPGTKRRKNTTTSTTKRKETTPITTTTPISSITKFFEMKIKVETEEKTKQQLNKKQQRTTEDNKQQQQPTKLTTITNNKPAEQQQHENKEQVPMSNSLTNSSYEEPARVDLTVTPSTETHPISPTLLPPLAVTQNRSLAKKFPPRNLYEKIQNHPSLEPRTGRGVHVYSNGTSMNASRGTRDNMSGHH